MSTYPLNLKRTHLLVTLGLVQKDVEENVDHTRNISDWSCFYVNFFFESKTQGANVTLFDHRKLIDPYYASKFVC